MEDAGFVVIVVVVPLSQVCLSGRRRRRRRARRRMHDHVFVVSSLSSRKKEECRKFCFSFVASWSLLVVCCSFERNGNACLYVRLFFSSFRLQVLAGSCRGDACPQAATISATTTTHPLWYLTTTCCRLGRACMASMTCATITGKDSSVSLSLSLSFSLLLSSWSCFLNTSKETVVCLHRLLLSSLMMHHAG
jgi:hypothetical protein